MNKWNSLFLSLSVIVLLILSSLSSCVHPPVEPTDMMPVDTTKDPDPEPEAGVCTPDTVIFATDILPFLLVKCDNCHTTQTTKDVNVSSYTQLINSDIVEAGNASESKIMKMITEDDPDKIMPPTSTNNPLTQYEIDLVESWINQGAKDLSCDLAADCDTAGVGYLAFIKPLIDHHCVGCHRGANPGGGVFLNNYASIVAAAESGALYGSTSHREGYYPMPENEPQLDECEILKIKYWVNAGTPDG